MSQNTSSAVMERRAPELVAADDAERAKWRSVDWFATPPFASRAGAELVKAIDPQARKIWEPACGDGIMAECLREYFPSDENGGVFATDIVPRDGYGQATIDFLNDGYEPSPELRPDWVITNPPFNTASDFVLNGLKVARRGVAVLCRLAFLETVDRYCLHFCGENHLTHLGIFCERVPMQLGPWNPEMFNGHGLCVVRLLQA